MAELPSGTVTFLFTDIEGSTRLLHRLGQHRYDELLTAHREILLAAFSAHEGRVVDSQGDSFFVAFRTAADAVAAAVDAQRDLAAHTWLGGAEVKVRMGLHTGEPKMGQDRYVGIGVHRAARIGAAGHGGQVLLSWTTKGLAEEDLPPGVTIRDLGERRLKDIEQPQRLYQLVIEGLQSDFAKLRTLDVELKRKRRRMYAGSALIGVVAAAVAIPVFAFGQGSSGSGLTVKPNSLALIDPSSNRIVDSVPNVGARPASISYGSGSLWVANLDDDTVARVDPRTRAVLRSIPVAATQTALAAGAGAVWIANGPAGTLSRIDPLYGTLAAPIDLKRPAASFADPLPAMAVAVGRHAVWVASSDGTVSRIDPARNRVVAKSQPGRSATAFAVGAGAVWELGPGYSSGSVTRIDPTGLVTRIPVGHLPSAILVSKGAVWVADSGDDQVLRIDPDTNAVAAAFAVGKNPVALASGGGSIWVANAGDGTVSRIDPKSPQVKTITVGGSPAGLAYTDGFLWVSVQATTLGLFAGGQAGTAQLVDNAIDSTDPALAYTSDDWQLEYATCAKLVNYPDKPGPAGTQLVPEVAQTLPRISNGGKTYTFTIRQGYRFSPPSNEPVTAQSFKYAVERSLSRSMHGPASTTSYAGRRGYLSDVVGEQRYVAGKAAHIAGVTASGDTLTIRLSSADGSLPARLTMPFFCAVPLGTPLAPKGLPTIPSAGPYYVASYTPNQQLVLKRNPNYHGTRPRHFEQIVYTIGGSAERLIGQVTAGQADFYPQVFGLTPARLARLVARYGPGSTAARAGRQQLYVSPQLTQWPLSFNTKRPLFRNVSMRKAVNYALDRRALIRHTPGLGEPNDQYLPAGMPGYQDAHIYPLDHPDLAKAKRLVAGRAAHAVLVRECDLPLCIERSQVLKEQLQAIGIDAQVKPATYAGPAWDIKQNGWGADYADPTAVLDFYFRNDKGSFSNFDDPSFNRRLDKAATLTGPERYRVYGQIAVDLAREAAPLAAYNTSESADLFSTRIGCQLFQPVYGMDLGALCIRQK